MRLIIAGSRSLTDYALFQRCIQQTQFAAELQPNTCTILSGTARGIDSLAIRWARMRQFQVERYPAEWKMFGKSAGYKRNEHMVRNAEALLAIWDRNSCGTKYCITFARDHSLLVEVFEVFDDNEIIVSRFNF